MSGKVFLFSFM